MNIKVPKLKFNNPIGEHTLDEMIDLFDIKSSDTIVDIGGGNGAVLLKMLKNNNAKGILIDLDEKLVKTCEEHAKSIDSPERLTLVTEDAKAYLKTLKPDSIDCFICIGSTFIFDDYLNFIKEVMPYLKTNGFLLIGEGFWMKKPSEEYLKILGGTESELMYHHENIEAPEKLGLTYLYSHIASEYDWNKFEGVYFLEEEYKIRQLPEAERPKKLKELRDFRNIQFKYGRSTMGFGLYLFEKTS